MAAYFTRTGGGVFANPPTTISSDLIPAIDNFYNIGSAAYRWKSLSLGPGTLFLTDTALGTPAGITVTNGQLLTNNSSGAALITGNLVLIDTVTQVPTNLTVQNGTMLLNNVQSIRTGNVNFIDAITGYAATMNVQNKVLTFSNVNSVKAGNVIYSDGLTQSNAYIKPTSNVLPSKPTVTALTVDLSTSNSFIHCHGFPGTGVPVTITNPTPAKEVSVFILFDGSPPPVVPGSAPWGYLTCGTISVNNILSANAYDSSSGYYSWQKFCNFKVTSVDSTLANTFMVIHNYYHP